MGDLWVVTCSGDNHEEYEDWQGFNDEFRGLVDDPNIAIDEIKKIIDWYNDADPDQEVDNYKEEENDDSITISFDVDTGWGVVWSYWYDIRKAKFNNRFGEEFIKEATKE